MVQIKFLISPEDKQRMRQLQFLISSVMDEKVTQSQIFRLALDALQKEFIEQMGPPDAKLDGIKKMMGVFFVDNRGNP